MDVISTCALRVASLLWQPAPGAFALAFACKATYLLTPGTAPLAQVQEDPWKRDEHEGGDPRGPLLRATDLVPFKRSADVILVGQAYAPDGGSVGSLAARLVVGAVDKTIVVHGDRRISTDDQISEPVPFTRAPLRWERAAGGAGTANPVGMAIDLPGVHGATPVPNLLPPDLRHVSRHRPVAPAGFGPVAPSWPWRAEKLRRHALTWDHRRWMEQPLPADVDAGYFNAAPPDQQVAELRADERILLENLNAHHPRLVCNLQPLAPRAYAEVGGGAPHEVRLRCDTLWIDTDRVTASLVWRGNLRLADPLQPGRVVVMLDARAVQVAMPGPSAPAPAPQPPAASVHPVATLSGAEARAKFGGTSAVDPSMIQRGEALPFGQSAAGPPPAPPPPEPSPGLALPGLAAIHAKFAGTSAIDPSVLQKAAALPFGQGPSTLATPPAPPPADALPELTKLHAKFGSTAGIDPVSLRRVATPFETDASPPSVVPVPLIRLEPPTPPPPATPEIAAPPPMIGPLATLELAIAPAPQPPPVEPPPAPPEPAPPEEAPLPLDAFPLDRCAAITASIARRKRDKVAILQRHELTEEQWTALSAHWGEAIQEELKQGRRDSLLAFDAAYLDRLEAERGILTVDDYARLAVSVERGTTAEVLGALDLPGGAMPRIQRVWLKKMSQSPPLGKRVREAVQRAGKG